MVRSRTTDNDHPEGSQPVWVAFSRWKKAAGFQSGIAAFDEKDDQNPRNISNEKIDRDQDRERSKSKSRIENDPDQLSTQKPEQNENFNNSLSIH